MASGSKRLPSPDSIENLEEGRKKIIKLSANICDLEENKKRWLFVGLFLHNVISPFLRKYVEPALVQLWQTLKTSHSIDSQQYPNQLMSYPPTTRLNYEPINNNKDFHGNQYNNRTKQNNPNYDYRVSSPVDLSKLFLQTHMAHYTAFDDSCDSSALLGMIININVFQQTVKDAARKIKDELRNPWAHCNFTEWNDTKYKDSIKLIEKFLRSLQLPRDDEDELFLLFNRWIGHGDKIINGSSPEQELIKEVREHINNMVQNVSVIAGNHKEQIDKLQTELTKVDKVLADHSCRINTLEKRQNTHSEQIKSTNLRQDKVDSQLNDPVPVNVREQIKKELERWMEKDKKYVPTRANKHVGIIIQDKSCVTITGPSGCGKTFTARHTALVLKKQGYDIIPIYTATDIRDYYKPGRKTCFIVDDICGNFTANQQQVDTWRQVLPVIENIVKDKSCKIIVSCRLQVFNDNRFKLLKPFTSCECNLVSIDNLLTTAEKADLIKQYTYMTVSNEDIENYLECVGPLLPLLCSLYRANSGVSVMQFLQNPFDIIENELETLFDQQGDDGKYKICALTLIVLFNNKVKDQWFEGKVTEQQKKLFDDLCDACGLSTRLTKKHVESAFKTLLDSFIQKRNSSFKAVHDKIFDFLVWYFGQKMIECMIDHGTVELLHERMRYNLVNSYASKNQGISKQSEDMKFIINIPEKNLARYLDRLVQEWSDGNVVKVFENFNMKNQLFRKKFLSYLKRLDIKDQKNLVTCRDEGNLSLLFNYRPGSTPLIESCYYGYKDFAIWMFTFDVNINQTGVHEKTALHWSCEKNRLEIVNLLLDKNSKVNKTDDEGQSPLYLAISNDNLDIVRMLLEKNPDVNQADGDVVSPLCLACKKNNLDMVSMLLEKISDINQTGKSRKTPLYRACKANSVDMVKMLLKRNPDVNKTDFFGISPLHLACRNNNLEIVRLLLEKNPDIHITDIDGNGPLYWACKNNNADMLEIFFEKYSYFDLMDDLDYGYNLTPLHWVSYSDNVDVIRMVLGRYPDTCINVTTLSEESPLYWACDNNNLDMVKLLLESNPDINLTSLKEIPLLYSACSNNNLEMVKYLLEKHADVNLARWLEESPLYQACDNDNLEMIRMLLEKNPDVNLSHWTGDSPLNCACRKNNQAMVSMLLEKNPNVNKTGRRGQSPLYLACENNNLDMVSMLLERSPDVNLVDYSKQSPLFWASKNNNLKIVSMLLEKNPNVNQADYWGRSSLYWACKNNNLDMVSMLLKRNPDVNHTNDEGQSPLYWACENNNLDMVRKLLEKNHDFNIVQSVIHRSLKNENLDGNILDALITEF